MADRNGLYLYLLLALGVSLLAVAGTLVTFCTPVLICRQQPAWGCWRWLPLPASPRSFLPALFPC